jgi:uncharacterized protein YecE (DUF72 family)
VKIVLCAPSPHIGTNTHTRKDPYTSDDSRDMLTELTKEVKGWQHGPHQLHIDQDNTKQHTANQYKVAATMGGCPLVEG